jgi:hypothetical protein
VEEERIKSSLELAMEKISGLPQLTPEEIAAQKEREYRPIGETICNKYLDGVISHDALPAELARYQGEQGRIVRRAVCRCLCRSIDIEDRRAAMAAFAGLASLLSDKRELLEEAGKDLRRILDRFEREKQEKSLEFAILAIRQLEDLGIAGSAVEPNLSENAGWLEELAGMKRSYERGLEKIRDMILREAA